MKSDLNCQLAAILSAWFSDFDKNLCLMYESFMYGNSCPVFGYCAIKGKTKKHSYVFSGIFILLIP